MLTQSGGGWNANAAAASWESNKANGAGEWREEGTQSNMDDGNHGSAENDSGGCFNCGDRKSTTSMLTDLDIF